MERERNEREGERTRRKDRVGERRLVPKYNREEDGDVEEQVHEERQESTIRDEASEEERDDRSSGIE